MGERPGFLEKYTEGDSRGMEGALGYVPPGREEPQKLMPPGATLEGAKLTVKGLAVPGGQLIGSEAC